MKFLLAWLEQQKFTKLKLVRIWFKIDHNSMITSGWIGSSRSFPIILNRVKSRKSNQIKVKKGTLVVWLLELSRNVLVRSGLYFEKKFHKRSNKDIHWVFMFFSILSPFVSIKSISLVNTRCIFRLWAK